MKQQRWIPVSERLPGDCVAVNVTWINRNPESYYESIMNVPFTDTAVYCNGEWYWYSSTCVDYLEEYGRCGWELVDKDIDIIAWMPLSEPYSAEAEKPRTNADRIRSMTDEVRDSMERLTEQFENGQAAVSGCGNNCKYDYKYCNNYLEDCPTIGEIYGKLAAYEDAEEQGLLLRLPCKETYSHSGDNVYLVYEDEIAECVHCGLSIDPVTGKGFIALAAEDNIFPYRNPDPEHDLDPTDWCNNATDVEISEVGNTLFFTREAAEAKLKEMGANNYE